jgi:type II secretory pathway pseudopilin PulG
MRQRGYALLAALLAVALVALAALVAVQRGQTEAKRERERELLFVGEEFRRAIMSYYAAGAGGVQQYPQALADLVKDNRQPVTVRYLRRIYADPMTGEADWVLEKAGERIIGVHSPSRGVPLIRTGFAAVESGFAQAETYADWQFTASSTDANLGAQLGQSPVLGTLPAAQNSAPGSAPTPASTAPNNNQIFLNNQCYQQYVAPQADCTDEPPPYGKDQASCIRFLQALNASCLAAGASGSSSSGP